MKKSRYSEEQLPRRCGRSRPAPHSGVDQEPGGQRSHVLSTGGRVWAGGVGEIRRLRQLEEENCKLK